MGRKGYYLVFEGPDGSGKTTQSKNTLEYLKELGLKEKEDFIYLREPGGTKIGEQVRMALLDPENADMDVRTESLLYNASRSQSTKQIVMPAVDAGKLVVADRSYISTIAYQAVGLGMPIDQVEQTIMFAIYNFTPDSVYLFDLLPEVGLQRTGKDKDRIEQRDTVYHHRVRNGYLLYARANKDMFRIFDSTPSIEEVWEQVKLDLDNRILEEWFERSGR
ncbi:dTMP kinase [Candidatus Woesearchaeota archaeon]|nr:dTMP kinase [Candidatus Woesearchaeota archaeon]